MNHDYDMILPNFEFSCAGPSNVADNRSNLGLTLGLNDYVTPVVRPARSTTVTNVSTISINASDTVAGVTVSATKNFTGTAHSGSRWSQRDQSVFLEEYFAVSLF